MNLTRADFRLRPITKWSWKLKGVYLIGFSFLFKFNLILSVSKNTENVEK